jgi:phosphate transport system substrate-binding protein
MFHKHWTLLTAIGLVSITMLGCGRSDRGIRMEGSDTMVNLAQAWAEKYHDQHPEVTVQVLGGGSGVGIASLIDGNCDLANASREMEDKEIQRVKAKRGTDPKEHIVGYDALAVYVHKDNPLDTISIAELAEIYGQDGAISKWSQLGIDSKALGSDEITCVSRQNSSGTYVYFREAVLGKGRDYKLGTIDQSGSKDVVALIANTPSAIGYSGMGYAAPGVKMLKISAKKGEPGIAPTMENAMKKKDRYPITRSLLIYTAGEPSGQVKTFMDWILAAEGQKMVDQLGYVPVAKHE